NGTCLFLARPVSRSSPAAPGTDPRPVSSQVVRAARIILAAAAAAVAGLGAAHSAHADSTCPTATFLSFDHVAYISKAIPAGVEIPAGTGLGSGSVDQPPSPDASKRDRNPT